MHVQLDLEKSLLLCNNPALYGLFLPSKVLTLALPQFYKYCKNCRKIFVLDLDEQANLETIPMVLLYI